MDPLAYILAMLPRLDAHYRRTHHLLLNKEGARLVYLSFSSTESCEIIEVATAEDPPSLGAEVIKLFKRNGLDYLQPS